MPTSQEIISQIETLTDANNIEWSRVLTPQNPPFDYTANYQEFKLDLYSEELRIFKNNETIYTIADDLSNLVSKAESQIESRLSSLTSEFFDKIGLEVS